MNKEVRWEDWHTHNLLSWVTKKPLEENLEVLRKRKIETLGFSDHLPLNVDSHCDFKRFRNYFIQLEMLPIYFQEAERVKRLNESRVSSNQINLRFGIEINYIPEQEKFTHGLLSSYEKILDYKIAGVHMLKQEGRFLSVYDKKLRKECVDKDEYFRIYFETSERMLRSELDFDIVPHLDFIRILSMKAFKKWIKTNERLENLLDVIKKRDKTVEINSAQIRMHQEIEPSPMMSIIEMLHERDIPILLGSDAHKPEDIASHFRFALKCVKEAGYSYLAHYRHGKRFFVEI